MMEEGGDPTQCKDIARQLIEDRTGSQFKVIMGGGRTYFLPNTTADVEGGYGRRRDGRDLISLWQANHPDGYHVADRDGLLALNMNSVDSVLGTLDFVTLIITKHICVKSSRKSSCKDFVSQNNRVGILL